MIFNYEFCLPSRLIPEHFNYPISYLQLVDKELPDLHPWHFYYSIDDLEFHFKGLKKRYPSQLLVPFARRSDNDDVACFNASDNSAEPRVLIIHDFASPGWELRGTCENFDTWVKMAKEESEEYRKFFANKNSIYNEYD